MESNIRKSIKKFEKPQQTESISQRLAIVQEVLLQKFGAKRFFRTQKFQTSKIPQSEAEVQTDPTPNKNLKIDFQGSADLLLSYNYQGIMDKKLQLFEAMLTELSDEKNKGRKIPR